jgi:hypothetical protein
LAWKALRRLLQPTGLMMVTPVSTDDTALRIWTDEKNSNERVP